MARFRTPRPLKIVSTSLSVIALSVTLAVILYPPPPVSALTASIGQPYRGYLVNGVPFPRQFRGYDLRDEDRSYGTPELIGAVLDSLDRVLAKHPDSCDIFIGDLSLPQGGNMSRHRSHENGRDIDIGMYAKGNRPLGGFAPMSEENLDVEKTWDLIESFLQTRRVQLILIDRGLQRLLYSHALSRGHDQSYLDRLFGMACAPGERGIIQHAPGHRDHIHARFFAPWSTLAGQLGTLGENQRSAVSLAQEAYLPKKVNYYVQGNEAGLQSLAASFGVSARDLCRWNQLRGNEPLEPGSCLVFYKRGFELEPVRLAQSLQPNFALEAPVAVARPLPPSVPVRLASLNAKQPEAMLDVPRALRSDTRFERRAGGPAQVGHYTVRRGGTLASVAREMKIDPGVLSQMNGVQKNAVLKTGQKIKYPLGEGNTALSAPRDRAATRHGRGQPVVAPAGKVPARQDRLAKLTVPAPGGMAAAAGKNAPAAKTAASPTVAGKGKVSSAALTTKAAVSDKTAPAKAAAAAAKAPKAAKADAKPAAGARTSVPGDKKAPATVPEPKNKGTAVSLSNVKGKSARAL